MIPRAWLPPLVLAATLGCTDEKRVIDPFPIVFDISDGPVFLAASSSDDPPTEVTVDTLAPITIFDSLAVGQPLPEARRRKVDLTLYGLSAGRVPTVPRARFDQTVLIETHPCAARQLCEVGVGDQRRALHGIVGTDVLSRTSARFDFSTHTLRFFPDAAGSDDERGDLCEAVFDDPFAGAGTLILGAETVGYAARRPALGACLASADAADPSSAGIDATLVLSTGLGITILSETIYRRYAALVGAPAAADLPATTVWLPSGPIPARLGQLGQFSLVSEVGKDSRQRGPCRELYANHLLSVDACAVTLGAPDAGTAHDAGAPADAGIVPEDLECPCPDGDLFCRAGAAITLSRTIPVAVIADTEPLLQALRDELRPEFPEVDGILGVGALTSLQVELDYPNNRILMKCLVGGDCETHIAVQSDRDNLDEIARCHELAPDARDASVDASPSDAGTSDASEIDGGVI